MEMSERRKTLTECRIAGENWQPRPRKQLISQMLISPEGVGTLEIRQREDLRSLADCHKTHLAGEPQESSGMKSSEIDSEVLMMTPGRVVWTAHESAGGGLCDIYTARLKGLGEHAGVFKPPSWQIVSLPTRQPSPPPPPSPVRCALH